ncbi:MAG: alkaline phosphatase family protein [Oscillospiraceae bacterium]|nr:alkaline phosphatase family protein [Oscillospiraceae bacterium]
MKQKLFVLSMDAMVHEDVAYMMTKPNFRKIMEKRAEVEKVLSVFPAITYPAHTTMMTGCYPGKHGIYNNVPFKDYDDKKKHWYLDSKVIRVEDIFAAAKRAGCTTASVYWPITGNNPNVDYIINEYFFFYRDESPEQAFTKMGADEVAMKAVRDNYEFLPPRVHPEGKSKLGFDPFIMACTCSLIRDAKPDVLLVHNCALDSARHTDGVFGKSVFEALDRTDAWLGDVLAAMTDAGTYEDTNFVILSDHGQMDYEKRIRPNVLLAKGGFLDVAPDGTVYDWQAFAQNNAMSASVYLRDPNNKKLYDKVYAYLQKLVDEKKWGLTKVYTTEEAKEKYGTYGPFSFMLATDGKTSVSEAWTEDAIEILGADEQKPLCGTHGYEPELGPQPVFLAHGPAFKHGAVLENAKLVDIAPTLAAVLGETMPEADGRVLTELLK